MTRIGLIGCGAMGTTIAEALLSQQISGSELCSVYDVRKDLAEKVAAKGNGSVTIASRVQDMVDRKDIDLIVEAAAQEAAKQYLPAVLAGGKSAVVMSVGVFADDVFFTEMQSLAKRNGCRLIVPSGAIAGIDGIKAAKRSGLHSVSLRVRKPPKSFSGAPYVVKNKIDLDSIKEPTVLFDGPAREAAQHFPANVNVAVTLGLAGIGLDKTNVQVVADPGISRNIHQIVASGESGRIEIGLENVPAPDNPKTSFLAILSILRRLQDLNETIVIGT